MGGGGIGKYICTNSTAKYKMKACICASRVGNSMGPDQLTDLDLHCFQIWI